MKEKDSIMVGQPSFDLNIMVVGNLLPSIFQVYRMTTCNCPLASKVLATFYAPYRGRPFDRDLTTFKKYILYSWKFGPLATHEVGGLPSSNGIFMQSSELRPDVMKSQGLRGQNMILLIFIRTPCLYAFFISVVKDQGPVT